MYNKLNWQIFRVENYNKWEDLGILKGHFLKRKGKYSCEGEIGYFIEWKIMCIESENEDLELNDISLFRNIMHL